MAPKAAVVHLVLVPLLSLILPISSLALAQDFCVADMARPDTLSGYPCKPKALVDSNDFYSDALAKPGPVIQPFDIGLASATVKHADTNIPYVKTLNKGDLFVFPQGLLHFQYNIGNSTAIAFAAYSSPNPGLQITDYALFGDTLPTDVVAKLTFIVRAEVERLKRFFGIVSVP
ncbi:unnamed protein product [Miscanthus lutarioriparius]|uniref:Germin-like protein n=1 Tax=Miscanthus lutarioriparius TaxID=422564 RepID=A0A811PPC4_9POAL|nr:unnamed protein product [Miscanthus lutarioriparius]